MTRRYQSVKVRTRRINKCYAAIPKCEGTILRWVDPPPSTLKTETGFNTTYELILTSDFYTWAVTQNFFQTKGFTDGPTAQAWCENTVCPSASAATADNCCIHHVNVHSCPRARTSFCGPWIPHDGQVFTHSEALVGPVQQGNWTSYVPGFYESGLTSVIAHFKVADMHYALETVINVVPKSVCGDGTCDTDLLEDCSTCPRDCGKCPLQAHEIALIVVFSCLVVIAGVIVFIYFQYQKRKLLWDESWIIPYEKVQEDEGLRGAFGSMISVNMGASTDLTSGTTSNMSMSAQRKQVFAKTAIVEGKTVAVRNVKKKEFTLTKNIRIEVKEVRELDHQNLCKLVGCCTEVANFCVLVEYCPKGSISDVLLNDDIPLNWAFRFSFATDIARGMAYLHSYKITHGHLKSNNCVVDDRWTVKIADFGLTEIRRDDEMILTEDDKEDRYYKDKRNEVYIAPELKGGASVPSCNGDVYSYSIILVEIATRNDPFGDEDPFDIPKCWKPPLPDLSLEMAEDADSACPCPKDYNFLIADCWNDTPINRPTFESIKKTLHKINPHKMSPVDLMMNMMEKYSKHLESIVAERTQELVVEKQKTDRLLYSMLPKQVADDLKIGRRIEAESFDACTIYFSDIVGFTSISGGSTPIQVVALLNHLYTTFDSVIDKYDVYKVETIGDAYMVVSGIPCRTPFHAREVADMAIDLVSECTVFQIPHLPDTPLKIRVGLHSGSACAGVVAYKIHISNFTYLELKNIGGYQFEKRGTIPVKGKGDMVTWWLLGNDKKVTGSSNKDTPPVQQTILPPDDIKNDISSEEQKQDLIDYKEEQNTTLQNMKDTPYISDDKLFTPVELQDFGVYKEEQNTTLQNTEDISYISDDKLFTPVELPEEKPKTRKISQISTSNDSGYNEKQGSGSLDDVNEIVVKSYASLNDALSEEQENVRGKKTTHFLIPDGHE
ncbi:atrial natriuretic peptide receptor 1-like [Saccostrea cucullata]|uniref:atrial natriuretic peptide receptor 1-like n=1 Tax=Saccostrea cuccullata TaxID=36930 RepID=UPI002ED2C7E0